MAEQRWTIWRHAGSWPSPFWHVGTPPASVPVESVDVVPEAALSQAREERNQFAQDLADLRESMEGQGQELMEARERALDEVRERMESDDLLRNGLSEITIGVGKDRVEPLGEAGAEWALEQFTAFLNSISENKPQDQDRGGL